MEGYLLGVMDIWNKSKLLKYEQDTSIGSWL